MAQTATNVTAAKPASGGAVYRAPLGTTLPTNSTAALASAFVALGYCSQDGLTNNNNGTSDSLKSWGGDTVLTFQSEKEDTFGFTLLEALNADVLKTIYGEANVSGDLATGISVSSKADEPTEYVWVFDMITRGNATKRIVLPDAKITELGEITYSDTDAVGYQITLTAMAKDGVTHYEYIKAAGTGT